MFHYVTRHWTHKIQKFIVHNVMHGKQCRQNIYTVKSCFSDSSIYTKAQNEEHN